MKFLFTYLCGLLVGQVFTQSPAYNQFTTRDGLSGNTIYCGVQDRMGFLWFGTEQGLCRYDGSRFMQFGIADGLPDPEVLDLFCDNTGDLWISCFKANVCKRENGVIVNAQQDSLLSQIQIKKSLASVMQDGDGNIWISGRDKNLYRINGESFIKKSYSCDIQAIMQVQGSLFAIEPNGFLKMDNDGTVLKNIKATTPYSPTFSIFYNGVVSGNKLLVTSPHIMMFVLEGDTFRLVDENKQLSGKLFKDSKGQIWMGSPAKGAICFGADPDDLQHFQVYLPGKRINTVIEDNQGGYWFGTIGEGLYRLRPNGAIIYPLSEGQTQVNVTAIAAAPGGGVVAADDKGRVYRIGAGPQSVLTISDSDKYNKARAIINTTDKSCWIGTDKGSCKIENGKARWYTAPAAIKAMLLRHDSIWIGTGNSVYVFAPGSESAVNLGVERVTAMCADNQGWIWVGSTNGLKCENQNFKYNWGEEFPELKNKIIALGAGTSPFVWVATPQDGLMRMKVDKGKILTVERMNWCFKGALKNVQSLFCEPSGRVWIATNMGIYALGVDLKPIYFGLHDGLSNPDVNNLYVSGDTLWAATVSGVTSIPLSAGKLQNPVPVLVSAVRYRTGAERQLQNLLDNPQSVCKIPGNAALVEILFSVQDYNGSFSEDLECSVIKQMPSFYTVTFDNVYQFIKNGFSSVRETGFAEKGVFQLGLDLPPGKYLINAVARNKTGSVTASSDWLLIEKSPAWYETLLFWLFVWALSGWIVVKIVTDRNKFRKMQLQVAELRIQALQAQINPHFIGNSINAIQQFFYPPDAARASRYIAIFTRLLRKTMEFTDQHFISLKDELQYTDDYLQLAQLRFEDRFSYTINCESGIPEMTPFPAMILQPLLENATVHAMTHERELILDVRFFGNGEQLHCTVTDNGPGIDTMTSIARKQSPEHKSRGIEMIRKKVQTLNMLYHTNISITISDRSTLTPPLMGTQAEIIFTPKNAKSI